MNQELRQEEHNKINIPIKIFINICFIFNLIII